MHPDLTIIVPAIPERDDIYLQLFCQSLCMWNPDAIDRIQLIIVRQAPWDPRPGMFVLFNGGICIEVVDPQHPHVNGTVIWDTLAEWRKAWPLIKGRWLTTSHPECLWMPNRLRKTIEYLNDKQPKLALGNLRRQLDAGSGRSVLDHLSFKFDATLADSVQTSHWPWWIDEPQPSEDALWEEDLFFADVKWLEGWHMPTLCMDLPFQDVYDIMGKVMREVEYHPIHRMPMEAHKQLHLWHPKAYQCFMPEVRDWFAADKKWAGTQFVNTDLWNRLIRDRENIGDVSRKNMIELRYDPGGTVTRYLDAMRRAQVEGSIRFWQ